MILLIVAVPNFCLSITKFTTTGTLPFEPPILLILLARSVIHPVLRSRGITASRPFSPTPIIEGASKTPPFAYQLMPKCGTLGGTKLKLPDIDTCGNFKCGKLQEKLNLFLIVCIALDTAVLALLIGVVIADLIAFHVEVVLLFIESQILENLVLTFSIVFETVVLALLIGVTIVVLIAFHTLEAVLLIFSHVVESHVLTELIMFVTRSLIPCTELPIKVLILVHAVETAVLIFSH